MQNLRFTEEHLTKPRPSGIDVEVQLRHFVIVTYKVDPEVLRGHLHERFEPDCIDASDGTRKALVSAVCFLDQKFRLARCPWPRSTFGQINYRAYVTDTVTGEHVVWFFGTALASIFVHVPRTLWKLPWHRTRMRFDTDYDRARARYTRYRMVAKSDWAPAELGLDDTGDAPRRLEGFESLESGLVFLTHPLQGFFRLRDGGLGTYSIWHDRLQLTVADCRSASFGLFDRLGLVQEGDLSQLHSVLMQPKTDFTIYLPPKRL